jgi:serine/threonine protein kinase
MPPTPTADGGSYRPYTKVVGAEPLPGYKLLEPLGRGGFGEVWKCEAPGGLLKAIKFVSGEASDDGRGEERLHQELDAFQQIKTIRHPFLLTLERVEIVDHDLVMVMELADRQLQDRFRECRAEGLYGIPRDELLAYFADAAEALDMIAAKYELQHLDVKPANLFIVAGHVKVGDYGLVARLDPDCTKATHRGLTPKYVAPEVLKGQPCSRSDQYSLALVYQELLTGTFPYGGKSPQQLMMHHIGSRPDLSPLPPEDRPIVAQALAKKPEDRFGSCLGFVQALMSVSTVTSVPNIGMDVRRARVERSLSDMSLPVGEPIDPIDPASTSDAVNSTGGRRPGEVTQNVTLPAGSPPTVPAPPTTPPPQTMPAIGSGRLPQLITNRRPPVHPPPQLPAITPAPLAPLSEPSKPGDRKYAVTLAKIKSVLPASRLLGLGGNEVIAASDFIRILVEDAAAGAQIPQMPGDLGKLPDGTWVCQFPSTISAQVVALKLLVVRETWGVAIDQPDPSQVVLRKSAGGGGLWGAISGKKSKAGMEVVIQLPPVGRAVAEITVTGGLFGSPDKEFVRQAQDLLPRLMVDVRRELKNVEDRRQHPRVAADFPVTLYPIHSAGGVDMPIYGRLRDVSLGGLNVVTDSPMPTKYAYGVFEGLPDVANWAILIRFLRSHALGREHVHGGQFRTDL